MCSSGIHIRFVPAKVMMLLVFVFASLCSFAQDDEEITEVDSVYAPYIDTTASTYSYSDTVFDLVSADSAMYRPHAMPDSAVSRLLEDEAFWYVNSATEKPKEVKLKKPFFLQPWFKTLLWVIMIAAFVGIIIWFLMASDVRLFRRKPKAVQQYEEEELPEDIFSIDYDKEIARYTAESNTRMVIRLMYLHSLRLLAENGIIRYKMERTNSDYLMELYGSSYYKEFFRLTRNFEYTWYGKFAVSAVAFESITKEYQLFKNRLLS